MAKRDYPLASSQCLVLPSTDWPEGPAGPVPSFLGRCRKFSRNKEAAKDLIGSLSERKQVEDDIVATDGFDLPPFNCRSADFKVTGRGRAAEGRALDYRCGRGTEPQP